MKVMDVTQNFGFATISKPIVAYVSELRTGAALLGSRHPASGSVRRGMHQKIGSKHTTRLVPGAALCRRKYDIGPNRWSMEVGCVRAYICHPCT